MTEGEVPPEEGAAPAPVEETPAAEPEEVVNLEPEVVEEEEEEVVMCRDACRKGNDEEVARILEFGSSPNDRGLNDWPHLHHAAEQGRLTVVDVLVRAGGDINIRSTEHQFTALMIVAQRGNDDIILKHLLDHGADTEARDIYGMTALMWAVQMTNEFAKHAGKRRKEIVQVLAQAGATITATDDNGKSALDWARQCGDEESIIEVLEEAAPYQRRPTSPQLEACLLQSIVEEYQGPLDQQGRYCGHSEVKIFQGNSYSGATRSSGLHGSGEYKWEDGVTYTGQFFHHEISGMGRFEWPDGSFYEGGTLLGQRHGQGTFCNADGSIKYSGQWKEGMRHGEGTLTYGASGDVYYTGNWKAHKKDGFGTMKYESGNVYEGNWREDMKCGKGTMHWTNLNERYTGDWMDGVQHGYGEHIWFSEANENPEEQMEKKTSLSIMCNRYEGRWEKGLRSGFGTFYYANGAKYEGQWQNNRKQGRGTFTFEDGREYYGDFDNDTMCDEIPSGQLPQELGGDQFLLDITDLLPEDETKAKDALARVFGVLLRHNTEIRKIYRYYSKLSVVTGPDLEGVFALNMRQFWEFCADCKLASLATPQHAIDKAFIRHFKPVRQRPGTPRLHKEIVPGTAHHPETIVLFRHFLEGLVRLAHMKFPESTSLSAQLSLLLTDYVLPNATKSEPYRAILLDEEVQRVVFERRNQLLTIYEFIAKRDRILETARRKDVIMPIRKFMSIFSDTSLLDENLTLSTAIDCVVKPLYVPPAKEEDEPLPPEALSLDITFFEYVVAMCLCGKTKIAFDDVSDAEAIAEFMDKYLFPNVKVF